MARRNGIRALIIVACGAIATRCGGGPTEPSTQIPTLTITCPQPVTAQSVNGDAIPLTFSAPTASGGSAPVTTTCKPASGDRFSVGTTVVTCSAIDARGVAALCTFAVTVLAPPRLVGTRFVAFGDSITWGVDSPPVKTAAPSFAYPEQLQRRLSAYYQQQTPIVINEGLPGEYAQQTDRPGGVNRLPGVLQQDRPDILLLMEGTNDLLGPAPTAGDRAIAALLTMIRTAKQFGVKVAIATIPPQRAGGLRNRDRVAALIPEFNNRIRALAESESVPLIDVYNAMKDNLFLIGEDDLHPTVYGYEVMTDVFFKAVKANFEAQASSTMWDR